MPWRRRTGRHRNSWQRQGRAWRRCLARPKRPLLNSRENTRNCKHCKVSIAIFVPLLPYCLFARTEKSQAAHAAQLEDLSSNLSKQIEALERRIESLQSDLESKEESLRSSDARVQEASQKIAVLEEELSSARGELEKAHRARGEVEELLAAAKTEMETITVRLATMEEEHEGRLKQLDQAGQQKVLELTEKLNSATEQHQGTASELDQANEKIKELSLSAEEKIMQMERKHEEMYVC